MKKNRVILILAMSLLHLFAFSQIIKPVAKSKVTTKSSASQRSSSLAKRPVIKDTLAYNIQTTLNELNSYIRDNSQPIQILVGSYIGNDTWGNSYSSAIGIPTAVENTFIRRGVNRYEGIELWNWKSILMRAPKDQLPAQTFISLKSKVDSIINAMPQIAASDKKNSVTKISVYDNVSNAQYRYLYKADELTLLVEFVKPATQTEQQTIDSLTKVYYPGLSNPATAKSASERFTGALSSEGFSDEKREMIFEDELKVVADKDIKAAFEMLMGTYIKQTNLTSKLTEGQRSEIRRMATEIVNAYNAKWDPVVPASTTVSSNSSNWYQPQQSQQPQGKRVKCSLCNGVGQYEKVTYSHTYDGIYNKVTTNVTKWVVCDVCGGSGWVTKYKKH